MRSVSSGRPSLSSRGSIPPGYPRSAVPQRAPPTRAGCRSALLLGPDLRELDDRRRREAHVLDADPLALAVRVVAAGEDVRRRQAPLGERGAVGAAANRGPSRLEPDPPDRFLEV